MNFETKMKVDENGDMYSDAVYAEKNVVLKLKDGKEAVVGVQPSYSVPNVIKKENIGILYSYLNEQKDYLVERHNKAKQVIADTEKFSLEGLSDEMVKFNQIVSAANKKGADKERIKHLDTVAKNVLMNFEAKKNMTILMENITRINEQLTFIEKNFQPA